ncbi:MAG: hypothetical protein IH955_00765, partial [Chloroflexi bacterium]|nr:hypothetical protein [Chloroflexota bacterium]
MVGSGLVLCVLAAVNTGADTEQVLFQREGKHAFGGATQMESFYGLADVPNLAAAGSYSWTLTMTTAKWDIHEGEGVSARPALVVLDEVHIEASPDGERSRHECMLPVPVGTRSSG